MFIDFSKPIYSNVKYVLYYSTTCSASAEILEYYPRMAPKWRSQIAFVCIDKRIIDAITKYNVAVLENGKHIKIPDAIQSIPSLHIRDSNKYIEGSVILSFLKSEEKYWKDKHKYIEEANMYSLKPQNTPSITGVWNISAPQSYDAAYNSLIQDANYSYVN